MIKERECHILSYRQYQKITFFKIFWAGAGGHMDLHTDEHTDKDIIREKNFQKYIKWWIINNKLCFSAPDHL